MTVHPINFPSTVYHATIMEHKESIETKILINRPDAKLNLDFGKGFYTSTTLEQAVGRAKDLQEGLRHRGVVAKLHRGIVLQFDLDSKMLYNVQNTDYKVFSNPDEEWADFIYANRTEDSAQHSFTWTYGPMADGPTPYLCGKRKRGEITRDELLYGHVDPVSQRDVRGILPYKGNYDQLVFHDETFANSGVLTNCKLVKVVPNLANSQRG